MAWHLLANAIASRFEPPLLSLKQGLSVHVKKIQDDGKVIFNVQRVS